MLRVKELILSEDILYCKMKDYCVLDSVYLPSIVFGFFAGRRPFCRDTLYEFNELIEYRTNI